MASRSTWVLTYSKKKRTIMPEVTVTGQWLVTVPNEFKDKEEEYVKLVQSWMKHDAIGYLLQLPVEERFLAGPATVSVLHHKLDRDNK